LPVLTVSAWINPVRDLSDSGGEIVGRGEDDITDRSAFGMRVRAADSPWGHGVGVGYETDSDDDYTYGTDYYPPVGRWTHVAATRSGDGQLNIYADGSLIGHWDSTPVPASNCYQDLTIGAGRGDVSGPIVTVNFFPGFIDDVRIYNRALSAQEVLGLYEGRGACSL